MTASCDTSSRTLATSSAFNSWPDDKLSFCELLLLLASNSFFFFVLNPEGLISGAFSLSFFELDRRGFDLDPEGMFTRELALAATWRFFEVLLLPIRRSL
jgi:hypothetical protein